MSICRAGRAGEMRPNCAFGVIGAVLVGSYYLFASRVYYCGTGLFTAPGVRTLAPGFWLVVAGFAIALAGDLALVVVGRGSRTAARNHAVAEGL